MTEDFATFIEKFLSLLWIFYFAVISALWNTFHYLPCILWRIQTLTELINQQSITISYFTYKQYIIYIFCY